jgi:hypothetical protein
MNLLIENELRNNYLISLFELSYHLVKITHLPYETDISTFEILKPNYPSYFKNLTMKKDLKSNHIKLYSAKTLL